MCMHCPAEGLIKPDWQTDVDVRVMPMRVVSQPLRLAMVTSGAASLFLEPSNEVVQGAGEQLQHAHAGCQPPVRLVAVTPGMASLFFTATRCCMGW